MFHLALPQVPELFYPELYMKENDFEDSEERTLWRQKQCVDFSFLMAACSGIAHHYIQVVTQDMACACMCASMCA